MKYIFLVIVMVCLIVILYGKKRYGHEAQIWYGAGKVIYLWLSFFIKPEQIILQKKRSVQIATREELNLWWEATWIQILGYSCLIIMMISFLGCIVTVKSEQEYSDKIILQRDDYNGDITQYTLQAQTENGKQDVTVNVSPREYSKQQIENLFKEGFKYVWKQFPGENKSLEQVSESLCMISEIPDSPIQISWSTEPENYIKEDGKLIENNIEDNQQVTVFVQLKYGKEMRQQSQIVFLKRKIYSKQEIIIKKCKETFALCNKKEPEKATVTIPNEVAGVRVQQEHKDSTSKMFLLSICIVPIMLILKEYEVLQKEIERRAHVLTLEYPELISKLVLYLGAGMTVKMSFAQICQEYETQKENFVHKKKKYSKNYVYEELGAAMKQIQAGKSELQCYEHWGKQLGESHYIKLASMLSRNLQKGSNGLLQMLMQEKDMALREQRDIVKKLGEEAGTKLLFPMMLLLVTTMVIVMVPAFLSF